MRTLPWLFPLIVLTFGCAGRSHTLFACGSKQCDSATQYCADNATTSTKSCEMLPSTCVDSPSCQCLMNAGLTDWPACYCGETYECTLTQGMPSSGTGGGGGGGPLDAGTD
jgi:hypothetical protein